MAAEDSRTSNTLRLACDTILSWVRLHTSTVWTGEARPLGTRGAQAELRQLDRGSSRPATAFQDGTDTAYVRPQDFT